MSSIADQMPLERGELTLLNLAAAVHIISSDQGHPSSESLITHVKGLVKNLKGTLGLHFSHNSALK